MNAASEANLGSGLFIAVVRVLPRKSDNSYFNPTISYFFFAIAWAIKRFMGTVFHDIQGRREFFSYPNIYRSARET